MVTVRDIMDLEKFKAFRLIAGEKGLDRQVIRGGFIDHESIEDILHDDIGHEMILSNLPMIKGHPEEIVDYIRALIESRTACFALKLTLFKEIPKEAIELANTYDYPLFVFEEVFLDKLIVDIDRLINDRQRLEKKLAIIRKIQREKLSLQEVRVLSNELNKYFFKNLMVCLVKESKTNILGLDVELARSLLGRSALIIPFDEINMIVYSDESEIEDTNSILYKLGLKPENYILGTSSVSSEHGKLGTLMVEAKYALQYAILKNTATANYKDLGIYQFLLQIADHSDFNYFYKDIINKIIDYDRVHNSDLLETTIAFIKCDGNIKTTAEALFQHSNTVRFRIRKMKEVVEYDHFVGAKYETLALAIHFYELMESQDKLKKLTF